MRIGLLTYFWEDVPGQFFQALATVRALVSAFPEARVEMPDIRLWHPRLAVSRRDMLLRPWRNLARLRQRAAYNKARRECLPIRGPRMTSADPAEAGAEIVRRGYDLLVVGSDVVLFPWGGERLREGLTPVYWLADVPEVPRVMLASSSHTARYENLTREQRDTMARGLASFSFLAVRDPLTLNLLQALGTAKVPVRLVPDPTFAYEIDPLPAEELWARLRHRPGRPVCGLRLSPRDPFVRRLVQLLLRDFDVMLLGAAHPGCTGLLNLSPWEWSGIFRHFDLHVTMSMHETLFCLKQGVPVYTVERDPNRFDRHSGKSKCYFLHEEFGLLDRHYFNPYRGEITPADVHSRIMDTWQSFDRQHAIGHAAALGKRYMKTTQEMRRAVAGLLGLAE